MPRENVGKLLVDSFSQLYNLTTRRRQVDREQELRERQVGLDEAFRQKKFGESVRQFGVNAEQYADRTKSYDTPKPFDVERPGGVYRQFLDSDLNLEKEVRVGDAPPDELENPWSAAGSGYIFNRGTGDMKRIPGGGSRSGGSGFGGGGSGGGGKIKSLTTKEETAYVDFMSKGTVDDTGYQDKAKVQTQRETFNKFINRAFINNPEAKKIFDSIMEDKQLSYDVVEKRLVELFDRGEISEDDANLILSKAPFIINMMRKTLEEDPSYDPKIKMGQLNR